jgi:phosphonoacetaldehyde hydrolase
MFAVPRIAEAFRAAHGRAAGPGDIDALYAEIEPLALDLIPRHAEPVPGLIEAVAALRARGVRIGSTTGYNRAMLDALLPAAAAHGYAPDAAVAASEVPAGRPAPFLAWEAAARVGAYPAAAIVHVGDTSVDVAAGRAAGMWSVAVAATGNAMGLDRRAFEALDASDRVARVAMARASLGSVGAHVVVDSVAELPAVVDQVERWLADGRVPQGVER